MGTITENGFNRDCSFPLALPKKIGGTKRKKRIKLNGRKGKKRK